MKLNKKYIDDLSFLNEQNELNLNNEQIERLSTFADLLIKKNETINLISRKDTENVVENHILISVLVNKYIPDKVKTCLDFGTGGGLPGIPLAILNSDIEFILLDSIKKKILSVDEFIKTLNLNNCKAYCERVESIDIKNQYTHFFDLIISRATVDLLNLFELNFDLLKNRSWILSLKGGDISEEIESLKQKYSKNIKSIKLSNLFYKPTNTRNEKEKKIITLEIQK